MTAERSCEIDTLQAIVGGFPAFVPHRLLWNGHLQTVAAAVFRGGRYPHRAKLHPVVLENGDTTFLHDDRPDDWVPGAPVAMLLHGLGGCARSSHMVRVSRRLNEVGVRTFRMDFRGCGFGEGLARLPYHGGCCDDVLWALQQIVPICGKSPLSLIGFSLGGNVTLKLLGEFHSQLPPSLVRAVVVSPPIDFNKCVDRLSAAPARYYDRYVAKRLYRQVRRSDQLVNHAPHIVDAPRPRNQREFDDLYTARVLGFATAEELYTDNSSLPSIEGIRIPTLLLASRDDPLVPVEMFEKLSPHRSLQIHLTDHGGHLGFISRGGIDPDRRWMDWRILDWLAADCVDEMQRTIAA